MLIACALQVFVFPPGTSLSNGPFHFVNGSQGAASVGKLRWLFDRTRRLTSGDPGTPDGFATAAAYRPEGTDSQRAKRTLGKGMVAHRHRSKTAERLGASHASGRTVLHEGAYADATHGPDGLRVEGSIRFEGFDPTVGASSVEKSLVQSYGLPLPMPILVPEEAASPTLIIADTSGLHYRGYARPGAKRTSARIDGAGGGCGGCIPRFNAFACEYSPELC